MEDNADLCHTPAEVFRKSGHKVVTALNGAEAQGLLKTSASINANVVACTKIS
ncbi:hypothetical protein HUU05_00295 [candidate division KSB1 bacterium]|nr:hypothetical protein [candidate division KSB1 bacterium]